MPEPPSNLSDFRRLMPIAAKTAQRLVEYIDPVADLDWDRPFWHMTLENQLDAHKAGELETASLGFAELRSLVGATAPAPTGMIFVPSKEGRSHSAAEWTAWDDIEAGANTLLHTLRQLST